MTIIDTADIRRRHRGHWFSPGACRFFASRISETAYRTDDGARAYFVTSERFEKAPRRFTVRCYVYDTDDVFTVGEFQAYASRSGAVHAAQRLARLASGEAIGV